MALQSYDLGISNTNIATSDNGSTPQAYGSLAVTGTQSRTITSIDYFVSTAATGTGVVQVGIYSPVSNTQSTRISASDVRATAPPLSINVMDLTTPAVLQPNTLYYLVVYFTFASMQIVGFNRSINQGVTTHIPISFRHTNTTFTQLPPSFTAMEFFSKTSWLAAI